MYRFFPSLTTSRSSSNVTCSTKKKIIYLCTNSDDIDVKDDHEYRDEDYVDDDDAISQLHNVKLHPEQIAFPSLRI